MSVSARSLLIARLADIPEDCWQRVDGLRCERGVINLCDITFRWALRSLYWQGLVEKGRSRDIRPLPMYRLTSKGRHAAYAIGVMHGIHGV